MEIQNRWQRIGAWGGGSLLALSCDPTGATQQTVLAATATGLYSTKEHGASWQLAADLPASAMVTVAFAPAPAEGHQTPRGVFASSEQGRLYRSDDAGQSWQEVHSWAGLGMITGLAFSPNYAQDGHFFAATPEGVFRTQDHGQSWESSTFGLLDSEILSIACAPDYAESQVLWVGTASGGFFRSRNGGRSWRESGAGLPDAAIQCLLVSPTFIDDRQLYVGTEENGVYGSTDSGATWRPLGTELAVQSVNCLAAINGGQKLLAGASEGIYFSGNGGQNWQLAHNGKTLALAFAEIGDGMVLAALYGDGAAQSVDGGQSWRIAAEGLVAHAPPVVVQPTADLLYALDRDGDLACSADGGQSWEAAEIGPVGAVARYAGEAQAVVAAAVADTLFMRRVQSGAQEGWSAIASPAHEIGQLALSPAFNHDETVLISGAGNELFLTQNGGASWQIVPPPRARDMLLQIGLTASSASLLEGGSGKVPVVVADGEGVTIYAVTAAVNAQNNYQLYLWQSRDKGQSWEALAGFESETPAVLFLAPVPSTKQTLFAATQNRLIKLCADEADEWHVEQHFFADDLRITALAASPNYRVDATVYVGTNRGIFISSDDGATWQLRGKGLPQRPIVAILPWSESVRAVMLGGEIWALPADRSE
ncbi:MAG: hypothetical protein R3A44_34135 [Caldilineaceae bacterium]